jgi:hypothetical protein
MVIKDTTYDKYVPAASGIVLTEKLPHNWNQYDWEKELKPFIKKNRSVIYKDEIAEDSLWILIVRIAMEMENAARL